MKTATLWLLEGGIHTEIELVSKYVGASFWVRNTWKIPDPKYGGNNGVRGWTGNVDWREVLHSQKNQVQSSIELLKGAFPTDKIQQWTTPPPLRHPASVIATNKEEDDSNDNVSIFNNFAVDRLSLNARYIFKRLLEWRPVIFTICLVQILPPWVWCGICFGKMASIPRRASQSTWFGCCIF